MKSKPMLFPGLSKIITFLLCLILVACEKDNDSSIQTQLSKKEILVKYGWQVDEVLTNNSCNNSHYIRGGANTTGINYNAVRITFKNDGTGTYTTDLGQTFPATWMFTSIDERNMEMAVSYPAIVTYIWNMVEINEKAFHQSTALISGSNNILVSARLIPVP